MGENLIFLLCQPRSGSTLLQHLLAGQQDVHTTGEPWLLLHPIYALRSDGIWAEFNAEYARIALEQFIGRLPDGRAHYLSGVRNAYLSLVDAELAVSGEGKTVFLDKTPRYYLIADELLEMFPRARFIYLKRNPLAVLLSIVTTNLAGDWTKLAARDRMLDLLAAPPAVVSAPATRTRTGVVSYEELVAQPRRVLGDLLGLLEMRYCDSMLNYSGRLNLPVDSRDSKAIYRHETPVEDYVDAWRGTLARRPALRLLAYGYLQALGRDVVQRLGYSFDELEGECLPVDVARARALWRALSTDPARRSKLDERCISRARLLDREGSEGAGWFQVVARRVAALSSLVRGKRS